MESSGHDVAMMKDLGKRLERIGDAPRAERVHTNLVEMLPNESESHQALAEIREEERRFGDAAEQWRQVVRVRSQEPTGYLGLARAQLAANDKRGARETLETLLGGKWDARFGDVKAQARDLLRQAARF
jgi:Flp pilus assembly protein TadD